jgi:hypothetical protein
MSWLDGLKEAFDGVMETATYMHADSAGARRRQANKAKKAAQGCAPCAAGAYVAGLQKFASPPASAFRARGGSRR